MGTRWGLIAFAVSTSVLYTEFMTRADRLRDNINKYTRQADVYMIQANEEFALGDLRQASEKAWGAAAQITKAVGDAAWVAAWAALELR